jgi:hypothetical protein
VHATFLLSNSKTTKYREIPLIEQAGSIAVVLVRGKASPYGRVRLRRDIVNHPADHRRGGKDGVSRCEGRGGREVGFNWAGSDVLGDNLRRSTRMVFKTTNLGRKRPDVGGRQPKHLLL